MTPGAFLIDALCISYNIKGELNIIFPVLLATFIS